MLARIMGGCSGAALKVAFSQVYTARLGKLETEILAYVVPSP